MGYLGKKPAEIDVDIEDASISATELAANSVDSSELVDGSIDTSHIADNQVTLAKMAGLARGKIIYGDASGDPAALTAGSNGQVLTSDGTDISWGSDAKLTTEEVQDIAGTMFSSNTESGITATYQDADGTIDLAVGSITSAMITDGTIATADIADDAVTSDKLDTNIAIGGTLGVTGAITGTLGTAAQTNITSLGTLTTLATRNDQNAETAISIQNASTASAAHAELLVKNSNGNVGGIRAHGSGFTTSNSSEADGFTIESYRQNLHITASNDKDIKFWNGTSNNVTFKNGGNVGIGDTAPEELLTMVAASGDCNIRMEGNAVRIKKSGSDWLSYDGSNLKLSTGNNERMRINSSGKVGIGVVPTHHFNLQGTGTVESRFRSTDGDISLQISSDADETHNSELAFLSGTSTRGSITYDHNTTAASQAMIFKAGDNANDALYIYGDGTVKVGLGGSGGDLVLQPTAKLYLDAGGDTYIQESAGNVISMFTGGTQRMKILANGNIVIGSGNEGGLFNCNGTSYFNNRMHMASSGDIQWTGGSYWTLNSASSDTDFILSTLNNSTERARFTSAGSFGVGVSPRGDMHFSSGTGTSGEYWGFGGGQSNTVFYVIDEDNAGVMVSHGNSSWSSHSDERIKENIVSLGTVMPDLKNMRCVRYNRIGKTDTKIGFIAQDWESKFSEVVDEDDGFVIDSGKVVTPDDSESTTKIKSISYTETIPVLLKAIQELEARITTLEG